ncbi:hypothetical protein [Pararhodobacter aggregans]|uniref:hypothetical protein n=1 Tax=Pararhodobacter aggregans TaxID=404875 RepID=UPI001057C394|nr:hypothetical protein [Pararhodobacter aggregans]
MAVACLVAALAGGSAYLFFALRDEERISSAYHFLPNIVVRSMILQGREIRSHHDTISGRAIRSQLVADIRTAIEHYPGEITGCGLPVELSGYGLDETLDTFSVMVQSRPMQFAVFFSGEVPDVQEFLDARSNAALLAPNATVATENEFVQAILTADLRNGYQILSSSGAVNGVSWVSERCDNYSMILFRGA